jgi:hypothetical protein
MRKYPSHIGGDFEMAYDSVRREVLYSILIEFGVPVKLVRLIKMCLNESYSKVRTGKNRSNAFPTQTDFETRRSFNSIPFQILLLLLLLLSSLFSLCLF